MEPLDVAHKKFAALAKEVGESKYWESLKTEADVRAKLIDRVFVDIMQWPLSDIHLEDPNNSGYVDYRMTIGSQSRLIVEAKKEGRDLGISPSHAARNFKLNGAVFKTEAAEEGINQLIRYCAEEGCELACCTNGRQWFIFKGSRLDGKKVREGTACVFGSIDAIGDKFTQFYDLLAYDKVENYNYRAVFHEAEGQPVRTRAFREIVRPAESRKFIQGHQLSRDLDRIMLSFFQDLSGKDDDEARRACFVTTSESDAAERNLSRISEELRNQLQSLSTKNPSEMTDVIMRAKEMQRHELILLVGTKGAGKTTFIDRFFSDVLTKELIESCVLVRVDLSPSGGDSTKIVDWLDKHVLEVSEVAAFQNHESNTPTYEDLQGMFFGEYERWRTSTHRHLYDRDTNEFKEKFGQYVESIRHDQPRDYILGLIRQISGSWKKVPCLVFDNADHFDVTFQEAVFNYANSIYSKSICLVILPITDTTSWQLPKQGPLQSFHTETFFLPTPPTDQVLQRRIKFVEDKIADEKPESGGENYFVGRGINLELDNIKAFTACLQTLFTGTGQVAEWIGRLANYDVRRSLQLTREIVSSPHVGVEDLLKAYVSKSTMVVNEEQLKLAIIRGKYDVYPVGTNSFIQNVFAMVSDIETTPLLPIRVLEFLRGVWQRNPDNDGRYVVVKDTAEYFEIAGVVPKSTQRCLNILLEKGLILDYDPTAKDITPSSRVQISPSGIQHLIWATQDWIYLESMATTTPILNQAVHDTIKASEREERADLLRASIISFIKYLSLEDKHFINFPSHDLYKGQHALANLYDRQLAELTLSGPSSSKIGRHRRSVGKIINWDCEKGYGFIEQAGNKDVFVHIKEFVNLSAGRVPAIDDSVEFDLAESDKGVNAVNALLLPDA